MTQAHSNPKPEWRMRLAHAALRLLGNLPLSFLHGIGNVIGLLAFYLPLRENRVARINIALCFSELTNDQQAKLRKQCLQETAKSLTELAYLWTRSDVAEKIQQVVGLQAFEQALAERQPVMIAAPHLGAWELLNLWIASLTPVTILYRAPAQLWLEQLLNRCRGRPMGKAHATPLRAEPQAVKALLKLLQAGGVVGILPDQKPKLGEGEHSLFFGQEALTMTLFSKLAQRTKAKVFIAYAERLPAGAGFIIHLRAAAPDVHNVNALNQNIEACVRELPAQYQWTYKRFSMRADGAKVY